MLDRIDLHVEAPAVEYKDLSSTESAEPSAAIRARVIARRIQRESNASSRKTRTIADLAGSPTIQPPHVMEVIQYRTLDRNLWH